MSRDFLQTPIEYLKGVGPKKAELLKSELNIHNFEDLLTYFPYRYVDRSTFTKIRDITTENTYYQIKGRITVPQLVGSAGTKRLIAYLTDETGFIELVWFQGIKWTLSKIIPGETYVVFGKVNLFNNRFNLPHPEIELASEYELSSLPIRPFYSTTEKLKSRGLDSKGIARLTRSLTEQISGKIEEFLPENIINDLQLISRAEAFKNIHYPENYELLQKAEYRLKFEELFLTQLILFKHKTNRSRLSRGYLCKTVGQYFNTFYSKHLPFELTNAQKRVIREIRNDMNTGKQMNRLLQGDVGSGKTLVALMCMLIVLDNGLQACLMAPTEILAQQHYRNITRFLGDMDINVKLLTSNTKPSERKIIHDQLLSGELQILIGTHALIEEKVRFKNLALAVIDEQHRFGVEQRARLWLKSDIPPHVLVMTATPIPRTLAMTIYGDLDVSVINELPPGRKPVLTYHYYDNKRPALYEFIRKKIAEGRQVYVVYPLIKESEKLDLAHVEEGFESLRKIFPEPTYKISKVHGQLPQEEKEKQMESFMKGESQIMVATTVIEVGVDIPNATIMVIENAERFGLSQLHQLRGRVGRGGDQSYCILMTDYKLSQEAKKRIETMVKTNDGFEIAEVDMRLRGPGDIQGTRQSGQLELKLADLVQDEKLLLTARSLAEKIIQEDPFLEKPQHRLLETYLQYFVKHRQDWSLIS